MTSAQAQLLSACRANMPEGLGPLWETMVHAPDVVLPDVVSGLEKLYPDPAERLERILSWLGHAGEECPVCWMLVGRLAFPIPELGQHLASLTSSQNEGVLRGLCRFLATRLSARHALPSGATREELSLLLSELQAWSEELRAPLGPVSERAGLSLTSLWPT